MSHRTSTLSNASSVGASGMVTSNRMIRSDDTLVQEMYHLKNDVQKMSDNLEMIQQILQTMTTLHPSAVASSSTPKYLGSLERNPAAVPPLFPQSAPWNWPSTWWTAPFGWMRPPINAQYTPMAPSPIQQEVSKNITFTFLYLCFPILFLYLLIYDF